MPRGRLSSDYGESAKLLQDRWDTETEACRNRVDQHTPHMNQTTQVFSLFGFFIMFVRLSLWLWENEPLSAWHARHLWPDSRRPRCLHGQRSLTRQAPPLHGWGGRCFAALLRFERAAGGPAFSFWPPSYVQKRISPHLAARFGPQLPHRYPYTLARKTGDGYRASGSSFIFVFRVVSPPPPIFFSLPPCSTLLLHLPQCVEAFAQRNPRLCVRTATGDDWTQRTGQGKAGLHALVYYRRSNLLSMIF